MNNTLNIKSLEPVIELLSKDNNYRKLNLTTGNCGCFALAIHELTGKGKIYEIGYCNHFLISFDNGKTFYDGMGHKTREEVKNKWEKYNEYLHEIYEDTPDLKQKIYNGTCRDTNIPLMKEIIIKLLNKEDFNTIKVFYDSEKKYKKPE